MRTSLKALLALPPALAAAWFGYSVFSAKEEPERVIDVSHIVDVVEQNEHLEKAYQESPFSTDLTHSKENGTESGLEERVLETDSQTSLAQNAEEGAELEQTALTARDIYQIILHGTNEELSRALRRYDPEEERFFVGEDFDKDLHDALLRKNNEFAFLYYLERGNYRIAAYFGEGAGIPVDKLRILVLNDSHDPFYSLEVRDAAENSSDTDFLYALHARRARNIAGGFEKDPELLPVLEREVQGLGIFDVQETFRLLAQSISEERYEALKPMVSRSLGDALDTVANVDYDSEPLIKILEDRDFYQLLPQRHFQAYVAAKIARSVRGESTGVKIWALENVLGDIQLLPESPDRSHLVTQVEGQISRTIEELSLGEDAAFQYGRVFDLGGSSQRLASPEAKQRIAIAQAQLHLNSVQNLLDTEPDEYLRNAWVVDHLLDAMVPYIQIGATDDVAKISERVLGLPEKWFGAFSQDSIPEIVTKTYPQFDAEIRRRCTLSQEIWEEERARERAEGKDEEEFQMPTETGY